VQREVAIVSGQASSSAPNAAPRKGPWAEFAAAQKVVGIAPTTVSAELLVLASPLTGDAIDQRDLALAGRVPLVITGPAVLSLAEPQPSASPTPSTPSTPQLPLSPREGETTLAALPVAAGIAARSPAHRSSPGAVAGAPVTRTSHTRILPPDAAAANHPLLAGVNIPPEGVVVPSALPGPALPSLLPNAVVLLWGEPTNADGTPAASTPATDGAASRQPVLWVTSQPRAPIAARGAAGTPPANLPPRRIVATTLGDEASLKHAMVRLVLERSIGWALDLPAGPGRAGATVP
jgi:hypothetical protein